MKDLLTDGLDELRRFAAGRALVALDFDGTLAPLCADPQAAMPRAATRALLSQVAELYDCVVISGRSHQDISRRLAGVELIAIVGNHGLEPWDATDEMAGEVGRWREALAARLHGVDGVEIEDKRYSLAIHYRRAPERQGALAAIDEAVRGLGPLRALEGKMVLNLLPLGTANKGSALERLRTEHGSERAIFVGDDITDEDVFASGADGLLGVRVGWSESSRAAFYLQDQPQIDRLLQLLVDLARSEELPAPRPAA